MSETTGSPSPSAAELSRRTFLTWGAAALGAAIAAVLGATGLSYFVSPAFRKDEEDWIDIGGVADVKAGSPVKVDFVARKRDAWVVTEKRSSAWVTTENGKDFTVFDPRCTHLGCPYRWDQASKQFMCPCHSAVFGPDGSVVSGPPPRPLDRYEVQVAAGRLLIQPKTQRKAA